MPFARRYRRFVDIGLGLRLPLAALFFLVEVIPGGRMLVGRNGDEVIADRRYRIVRRLNN